MVIRINELKLRPDHTKRELEQEIKSILRLNNVTLSEKSVCKKESDGGTKKARKDSGSCTYYEIMRRSVDARKKPELYFVYTVDVEADNPKAVLKRVKSRKVQLVEKREYKFPYDNANTGMEVFSTDKAKQPLVPVIVGSGPAGLFCGLMLARAGCCPVILERGEAVEQRTKTVDTFWKTGKLNEQSNVQFGEGGAGTFSDGKLNTLIRDPDGKIRFVLEEFVRAGASPEILYHHKPHIGTDVLVGVVRNIRKEIESLGGQVCFNSCLTGLERAGQPDGDWEKVPYHAPSDGGGSRHTPVYRLMINGGERQILTKCLVLAIGHSARDTFAMLHDFGLSMQPKAFATGLRMEHRQAVINDAMYGEDCPYELGAAPYKVTHKCEDGRGVYSFCMCPGGYVVNASSEEEMLAVNGMSYSDRGSLNANSAIVVTVSPEDYQADGPLSGMEFQRRLERAAYECGKGKIPVQRFEDFCTDEMTKHFGTVTPQQKGACSMANLRTILPEQLNKALIEGIHAFGEKMRGFDDPDALLSGVESRTSSPVRILRDETYQTEEGGIFPCGEGAGYAGGITSAAVDGIRVAEAVLNCIRKN